MSGNKIFLYGSNGFIGSKLKQQIKKNSKIHTVYPNYTTKNNINFTYDEHKNFWKKKIIKFNFLVYLSFNNDLKDLQKKTNQNISNTIIPLLALNDAIKDVKKKIRIIYLSTASIYGDQKKNLPVKEDASINLQNIYDHLKLISENILVNSNNKFLDYQILRLSNVYGINKSKKKQNNRQIVNKIINNCLIKKNIAIFGTGNYIRDYIHINDLCDLIEKFVTRNNLKENQIYNVGSGKKMTIKKLYTYIAKIISKKQKKDIKIKYINKKNFDDVSIFRNYYANISKVKLNLRWYPKINLLDSVIKQIDYNIKINNFKKRN
jgi:UDP-glucose 4-epimerase